MGGWAEGRWDEGAVLGGVEVVRALTRRRGVGGSLVAVCAEDLVERV